MLNARKRLRPGRRKGLTKVQVGTGPQHLREDWWNTDLRPFEGLDEAMDATKPWPWEGVLTHVYAEHFIEHLDVDGALDFLVHAGRALQPGGRMRLTTPSLEWVMVGHYRFDADDDTQVMDTLKSNRAFHGWGHRFLWSKPMLEHVIPALGWQGLTFHEYGESNDPEFTGIEAHGGWSWSGGYGSLWIVEAEKGDAPIARAPEVDELFQREFTQHVASGH